MCAITVAKNYVCGLWCKYVNVQLHTNDCGQSLTPGQPLSDRSPDAGVGG